jgi:hypothetical protein
VGEPGIGKSRLTREQAHRALQRRALASAETALEHARNLLPADDCAVHCDA